MFQFSDSRDQTNNQSFLSIYVGGQKTNDGPLGTQYVNTQLSMNESIKTNQKQLYNIHIFVKQFVILL